MNTSAIALDADVVDVACDEHSLRLTLADGRELAAPLAWFLDCWRRRRAGAPIGG